VVDVDKYTKTGATAQQKSHADGKQAVDLKNIRVAIYPKGKYWVAQGFEIDYTAQGKSVKDVQRAFEDGLTATIHQHLKVHGDIKNCLKFAPVRVRLAALEHAFKTQGALTAKFSQFSVHDVNVQIEYMALPAAA